MRAEAIAVLGVLRTYDDGKFLDETGRAALKLRGTCADSGCEMTAPTMSAVLADLDRLGWITRRILGRRTFEVTLTPAGLVDEIPDPDPPRRANRPTAKTPIVRPSSVEPAPGCFYVIASLGVAEVVSSEFVARWNPEILAGPFATSIDARAAARDLDVPIDSRDIAGEIDSLRSEDRALIGELITRLRSR